MGKLGLAMETLVGIQCDDCVLLMCDQSSMRSILRFNDEQDKIYKLDSHMAMASVEKKGGVRSVQRLCSKEPQALQPEDRHIFEHSRRLQLRKERTRCIPSQETVLCGSANWRLRQEWPCPILPGLPRKHAEADICSSWVCWVLCNGHH